MTLQQQQFFDTAPYTHAGPRLSEVSADPEVDRVHRRQAAQEANRGMRGRYSHTTNKGGPMLDSQRVFGVPKRLAWAGARDDPMGPFNPSLWRRLGTPAEIPVSQVSTQQQFTSQNRLMQMHLDPSTRVNPRLPDEHPLVEHTVRQHPRRKGETEDVYTIVQGNHRAMSHIGKGEIERRRTAWRQDDYQPQQQEMFMPAQVWHWSPEAERTARAAHDVLKSMKRESRSKHFKVPE